jgi:hypothetical protein
MPINHPYDPRHNPKVWFSKLTEEERRARATPLENLRGLRFRSETPAAPVAPASPPQIESVEIAPPQRLTPEVPTVEAPSADVPTLERSTPETVPQEDLAPDYVPAAWEVVFAAFPELYPEHAALACVDVAASGEEHAAPSPAPEPRQSLAFSSRLDTAKRIRTAGSAGGPPATRRRREETRGYPLLAPIDRLGCSRLPCSSGRRDACAPSRARMPCRPGLRCSTETTRGG